MTDCGLKLQTRRSLFNDVGRHRFEGSLKWTILTACAETRGRDMRLSDTHSHTHTQIMISGCTRAYASEHIFPKSFSCGTIHLKSQPNQQSTHRHVQTKPVKSIHSHFTRAGQLCVCMHVKKSLLRILDILWICWHRNAHYDTETQYNAQSMLFLTQHRHYASLSWSLHRCKWQTLINLDRCVY